MDMKFHKHQKNYSSPKQHTQRNEIWPNVDFHCKCYITFYAKCVRFIGQVTKTSEKRLYTVIFKNNLISRKYKARIKHFFC